MTSMATGLSYAFLTAILWTGVAVFYGRAGKARTPLLPLGFTVSAIGAIVSCVWVDWGSVITNPHPRLWSFVAIMVAAGALNQSGILLLARAMTLGHSAVTWAVGQSAISIPFLVATLCWHERVGASRGIGLVLVLTSLGFSAASRFAEHKSQASRFTLWLTVTGCSFACFGGGQSLRLLPSQWGDLGPLGPLRVTVALVASATLFLTLLAVRKQRPTEDSFRYALPIAACMLSGQYTLYRAADELAVHGLTGIVFPIGIGGSIIGFALYSQLVAKEKTSAMTWFGVGTGAVGVVLLALPRST